MGEQDARRWHESRHPSKLTDALYNFGPARITRQTPNAQEFPHPCARDGIAHWLQPRHRADAAGRNPDGI
ncbi:protein of unknown function [Methylococcus capsulatus]|uniref:Uncharacterized protein n=1 Tax=Methylococcus capsulatus TaxID=414 RepID=A0AA35V532_METCP|nr:protein of unknown function [Methylococcus capsulatus]